MPRIALFAAHELVRVADDAGPAAQRAERVAVARCASVSSGKNVARPASRSRK